MISKYATETGQKPFRKIIHISFKSQDWVGKVAKSNI